MSTRVKADASCCVCTWEIKTSCPIFFSTETSLIESLNTSIGKEKKGSVENSFEKHAAWDLRREKKASSLGNHVTRQHTFVNATWRFRLGVQLILVPVWIIFAFLVAPSRERKIKIYSFEHTIYVHSLSQLQFQGEHKQKSFMTEHTKECGIIKKLLRDIEKWAKRDRIREAIVRNGHRTKKMRAKVKKKESESSTKNAIYIRIAFN